MDAQPLLLDPAHEALGGLQGDATSRGIKVQNGINYDGIQACFIVDNIGQRIGVGIKKFLNPHALISVAERFFPAELYRTSFLYARVEAWGKIARQNLP